MEYCIIPLKTCKKCGQEFPATLEYFHPHKGNKDGLRGYCRVCYGKQRLEYQQANRNAQREYRQANQEKILEYQHSYNQTHKEKIAERDRKYHERNRDKRNKYNREYYLSKRNDEAENYRERNRAYYRANPDKTYIRNLRRRARVRSLPVNFTLQKWIDCLAYHNYCCAVCGKQLRDLLGDVVPHADHWIPLVSEDCPGTTPDNMICLCNSCNLSKGVKLPDVWLTERYGRKKANEILKRVADYFEWASKRE